MHKPEPNPKELDEQLRAQLQIDTTGLITADDFGYEALRDALAQRIAVMICENRQLLFATLYRIDVAEKDVRMAMGEKESALLLAELILKKLQEKLYWRNLYRNK